MGQRLICQGFCGGGCTLGGERFGETLGESLGQVAADTVEESGRVEIDGVGLDRPQREPIRLRGLGQLVPETLQRRFRIPCHIGRLPERNLAMYIFAPVHDPRREGGLAAGSSVVDHGVDQAARHVPLQFALEGHIQVAVDLFAAIAPCGRFQSDTPAGRRRDPARSLLPFPRAPAHYGFHAHAGEFPATRHKCQAVAGGQHPVSINDNPVAFDCANRAQVGAQRFRRVDGVPAIVGRFRLAPATGVSVASVQKRRGVAAVEGGVEFRREATDRLSGRCSGILRMAIQPLVNLCAVVPHHILDVGGVLQPPLDLERRNPCANQIAQPVVQPEILEGEQAAVVEQDASVGIHQVVERSAGLDAGAAVRAPAGQRLAEVALPAV